MNLFFYKLALLTEYYPNIIQHFLTVARIHYVTHNRIANVEYWEFEVVNRQSRCNRVQILDFSVDICLLTECSRCPLIVFHSRSTKSRGDNNTQAISTVKQGPKCETLCFFHIYYLFIYDIYHYLLYFIIYLLYTNVKDGRLTFKKFHI